jgi:formylglycine-generating enzyme
MDMQSTKLSAIAILLTLLSLLLITSCSEPFGVKGFLDNPDTKGTSDGEESGALYAPGETRTLTASGVSFTMVYVPGDLTIPTRSDDSETEYVPNATWTMQTEVTYELWYAVRDWAENTAPTPYTFANPGREGEPGVAGAAPTAASSQPVGAINWRDAMIFSNALTEWYNTMTGETLQPVYYSDGAFTTPIRSANNSTTITWEAGAGPSDGSQDDPFVKSDASGFRLPTMNEAEIAARYDGGDLNGDGDLLDAGEAYPGDYASGASGPVSDTAATNAVAWSPDNSGDTSHVVAQKPANALGIYDMSGNLAEMNFDWSPEHVGTRRIIRGGAYPSGYQMSWLAVSDRSRSQPYNDFITFGVRLVTNE